MIALVSLKSLLLYFCKQLIQALGPLTGKDGPIQFFQINTIPSMILMFFCNIDIDIDTVIVVLKPSQYILPVYGYCASRPQHRWYGIFGISIGLSLLNGSEKSWPCCFVCPYILMML